MKECLNEVTKTNTMDLSTVTNEWKEFNLFFFIFNLDLVSLNRFNVGIVCLLLSWFESWNVVSLPVVEGVAGSDSFVLPKIECVQVHWFWVSSSQFLSNVRIVHFLSVAPFHVANAETENSSECKSHHAHVKVDVIVEWHSCSLTQEVLSWDGTANQTCEASLNSSQNFVLVVKTPEI